MAIVMFALLHFMFCHKTVKFQKFYFENRDRDEGEEKRDLHHSIANV